MYALRKFLFYILAICTFLSSFTCFNGGTVVRANSSMPFYDLKPCDIVLRGKFFTSYATSTVERKSNIALAVSAINNTFIDVGGEFSFNKTVGVRTEKRGYKKAKIIVGGEFVDGVGGGVCQVSTTLYNAVLLAGLKITEFHPHSLPVHYVNPSFDAMVNSGSADLRFVNDTHNPIILRAIADGTRLNIEIYGEPMEEVITRHSVITEEIPALPEEEILDSASEYPDLYQGERLVVRYGRAGYKSEGYLVRSKNGRTISTEKIRTDKYGATRGLTVLGTAIRPLETPDERASEGQTINIE